MTTDDHEIGAVYEAIANWFDQNRARNLFEKPYLETLLHHLLDNPTVLDLGCGSGEPIARFLIEQRCCVTGVDGSLNMIVMCQERFPDMEWIHADMRTLQLHRQFDAIIAWDSFFHLSHEAQRGMFPIFAAHSLVGGVLLFNSGGEHGVAYGEMDGHTVYHASLDFAEYRSLLEENGFEVLSHSMNDPSCGGRTVWLAKKLG